MSAAGWIQVAAFVAILTALTAPLGAYLANVFGASRSADLGGGLAMLFGRYVPMLAALAVALLNFLPALMLGPLVQASTEGLF